LIAIADAFQGKSATFLSPALARMMATRQGGGPYGLGVVVAGSGSDLALVKRGQNVGCQSYMPIFPEIGQGMSSWRDRATARLWRLLSSVARRRFIAGRCSGPCSTDAKPRASKYSPEEIPPVG